MNGSSGDDYISIAHKESWVCCLLTDLIFWVGFGENGRIHHSGTKGSGASKSNAKVGILGGAIG